jgi:hypothetical protein
MDATSIPTTVYYVLGVIVIAGGGVVHSFKVALKVADFARTMEVFKGATNERIEELKARVGMSERLRQEDREAFNKAISGIEAGISEIKGILSEMRRPNRNP